MNMTPTILTSAVVAVAVSGLFTLWTTRQERQARRRELLFAKSVELAKAKVDLLVVVGEKTANKPVSHDHAVYAEMYYWLLEQLHDEGRLPEDWRSQIEKSFPT